MVFASCWGRVSRGVPSRPIWSNRPARYPNFASLGSKSTGSVTRLPPTTAPSGRSPALSSWSEAGQLTAPNRQRLPGQPLHLSESISLSRMSSSLFTHLCRPKSCEGPPTMLGDRFNASTVHAIRLYQMMLTPRPGKLSVGVRSIERVSPRRRRRWKFKNPDSTRSRNSPVSGCISSSSSTLHFRSISFLPHAPFSLLPWRSVQRRKGAGWARRRVSDRPGPGQSGLSAASVAGGDGGVG